MLLIQKGKPTKRACDQCYRVNVEIRGRPAWCEDCRDRALSRIVADYRKQVSAGIPTGQRSVMIPTEASVFDKRFHQKLRDAIEELDRSPRRLVAV